MELIDLTPENLTSETLCCIVRTKKQHPGVEAKRQWLSDRLHEGHVFRKVPGNGCAFLEYAPLETAWVPVVGDQFLYLYCLWVTGDAKGHGYGRALMESCLADARSAGKAGVCMLASDKQKAWLSDQSFAEAFGFQTVDTTPYGYRLLACCFDSRRPQFAPGVREGAIPNGLAIYYDDQCPFIPQRIEKLRAFCSENALPAQFVHVTSAAEAKALPCVFNNWAVCWNGRFATVNQLDGAALMRIVQKAQ